MKLDWWIWHCDHYMIIFGLGIPAKHGQVGQAKPGFPHFADIVVRLNGVLQTLNMPPKERLTIRLPPAHMLCTSVDQSQLPTTNNGLELPTLNAPPVIPNDEHQEKVRYLCRLHRPI